MALSELNIFLTAESTFKIRREKKALVVIVTVVLWSVIRREMGKWKGTSLISSPTMFIHIQNH